jgi:phosphate transport system substrate-binding protein
MKRLTFLTIILILFAFLLTACAPGRRDQEGQATASTYIENKGSDTIVNLALAWAEAYQQVRPEVAISVTGGGTGTGLAALANGTVDIANASRPIKAEEEALAERAGFDPEEFVIARDAIAVIVHPDNPVDELTLEEVAAIFKGEINNWSEVGGEDRIIVRVSRETNSGTHVYFLEEVIRLGNNKDRSIFSPTTLLLPSSEGIIAEVSDNPNAIGYDGLGYITPHVKVVAVSPLGTEQYIIPSLDTVNDGTYPISRDLYMYTRDIPTGVVLDYLTWLRGDEAQAIVRELGFVPYLEK